MYPDLKIVTLTPSDIDDFVRLLAVFQEVFEWENPSLPDKRHLQKVLDNPRFFVLVAKLDQQIVGGLTVHVLDRYDTEKPSAYIYDVAVLPAHQRKGIGQALMGTLLDHCEKHGFDEVFVQAEAEDQQAVDFYRKIAKGSEMRAVHFTFTMGEE